MSRTIGPKPYPTTFRRSLPFRRSLVAGGLLTAALLGAAAQAAPEEQRDPISLDLASADLRDVLRTFEHMTESPVDVDPRVEGKVTVRLEKVRWSTALDAICEGSGCTWELTTTSPRRLKIRPRSTGLVQEGLDTPVDLIADGVPASEALTAVAKATGRELSLDGDFSAPVRVLLDGVSAATALKALCESLACEWALTREGNALRVRPAPRSVPVSGEARDVSGELRERLRLSLDLSLAEAPLEAVLKSFGQILEVPVEIEEGVRGSVTIELSGTPFEGALNAVCAANDCRWSLESGGVGSKLRVTSALP